MRPGFLLTVWKTQSLHLQVAINKESLQVKVKARKQWQNSREGKNMSTLINCTVAQAGGKQVPRSYIVTQKTIKVNNNSGEFAATQWASTCNVTQWQKANQISGAVWEKACQSTSQWYSPSSSNITAGSSSVFRDHHKISEINTWNSQRNEAKQRSGTNSREVPYGKWQENGTKISWQIFSCFSLFPISILKQKDYALL